MRPLSAAELLTVWESNVQRLPLTQALAMLAAASPDETADELARLPIGSRNERLLTLRGWQFGPEMTALAGCPACGEQVELTCWVEDLQTQPEHGLHGPLPTLETQGGPVSFRLPNTYDLLAAGQAPDVYAARLIVARRCLQATEAISPDSLEPALLDRLAAAMETADPLALIELAAHCPHCDHDWSALLDVATFFWQEVQTWAQRTLRDVHLLARAYGWSEDEILKMSPVRRQAYLQLAYG